MGNNRKYGDSAMSKQDAVVSLDRVESLILSVRGRRVILDSDLARLYGVTTARVIAVMGTERAGLQSGGRKSTWETTSRKL